MIARENGPGKRISMPYDHYLKCILKVRAIAAKAIFVYCFRDPRGLLSRERVKFARHVGYCACSAVDRQ